MRKVPLSALAAAGALLVSTLQAQFADSVAAYTSGTGVNASFTNPNSALGEPSRVNPFGETVDPFNPPYGTNQIVSLGAGGFLTVQFSAPILNDASHPFGLDFLIFGNSGFVITNGDFTGGGITDGSLFGNNLGATRVSVSLDNITYFTLNPALAPTVDGLFPTDSTGDFQRPMDPSLNNAAFAGKDLTGIRGLYNGAAGGTGFDISWAQDGSGNTVSLPAINFVRVEVLSDKSEIDAFAVVPEPSVGWLLLGGIGVFWSLRSLARARRPRYEKADVLYSENGSRGAARPHPGPVNGRCSHGTLRPLPQESEHSR